MSKEFLPLNSISIIYSLFPIKRTCTIDDASNSLLVLVLLRAYFTVSLDNIYLFARIANKSYEIFLHCRQSPCKSWFTTLQMRINWEGSVLSEARIKRVSPSPTIDDLIVNASRASVCTMHVQNATGRFNQLLVAYTRLSYTASDLHTSPSHCVLHNFF